MRKLTILLALSLTPIFAESPALVVDSAHVAGQEWVVQVFNPASVSATAFLVGTSEKNFTSMDFLLGARDTHALLPNDTVEVKLQNDGSGEPRILAAIFEDGTTAGDRAWVSHLIFTRRLIANDLPRAITLARHAIAQNLEAAVPAQWFRQWDERYRETNNGESHPLWLAAEMVFSHAGRQKADEPARELIQTLEQVQARLAESKPGLW